MALDDSETEQMKSYVKRYLRQEEQNELDALRGGMYDDEYDDSYDEFTRMEVGTEGETLDAGKKGTGRGGAQGAGLRMDAEEEDAGSAESDGEEEKKDGTTAANGTERGGESSRGRGRGKGAGYLFIFIYLYSF